MVGRRSRGYSGGTTPSDSSSATRCYAPRRITPRFDAGVFLIDTGMLASVYAGEPSALQIEAGRVTAVYLDERELLVDTTAAPGAAVK